MSLQTQVIKESYALIDPRSEEFSNSFYRNLFIDHPQLEVLFEKTNMYEQRRKFSWSLIFVVQNSSHPDVLQSTLEGLGASHVQYGVRPEHYPLIGSTLLRTLGEYLKENWTSEVEQAWTEAFHAIAAVMLEGADYEPEILTLPTTPEAEPVSPPHSSPAPPLIVPKEDAVLAFQNEEATPIFQSVYALPQKTLRAIKFEQVKLVPTLTGLLGVLGSIILLIFLL